MLDGNWTINFAIPSDSGNGVISFQEGKIFGGDSGFYYFGKFELLKDHKYRAKVSIRRHTKGYPGLFGDRDKIELSLEGYETNNTFDFIGVLDFSQNMEIIVKGQKLTDC